MYGLMGYVSHGSSPHGLFRIFKNNIKDWHKPVL